MPKSKVSKRAASKEEMLTVDQARNLLPLEEEKVRANKNEEPLDRSQEDLN